MQATRQSPAGVPITCPEWRITPLQEAVAVLAYSIAKTFFKPHIRQPGSLAALWSAIQIFAVSASSRRVSQMYRLNLAFQVHFGFDLDISFFRVTLCPYVKGGSISAPHKPKDVRESS